MSPNGLLKHLTKSEEGFFGKGRSKPMEAAA
jgi:hypothetical protein